MKEYKFYGKTLTVEEFGKFAKRPFSSPNLVKMLRDKYPNKTIYLSSRLLKREYIFLCDEIFGSEEEFLIHSYGKILAGELHSINSKIEDWKKNVIEKIKTKLVFESEYISESLKPIILSTTKLFGQIDSKFLVSFRSKVGDDDSMSAYYDISIGEYKFRESVAGLSEYSNKPYKLAEEYKKKAIKLNNEIDDFNMNFISNHYLVKILNLEEINFKEYLENVLDLRYCFDPIKFIKLKKDFSDLIKRKIKSADYIFYLIPKKSITDTQNFFEINDLNSFHKTMIKQKDLEDWGITTIANNV